MSKRMISAVVVVVLTSFYNAQGQAQTPFYKGQTITIIAGTGAGNVYDLYARLFARHMGKYIPGNPDIIVRNMPGAASMIAANHLFNVSKPDGLTIGAIYPALYFDQVIGRSEVKFDWNKFIWLGSPVKSEHLLYIAPIPLINLLKTLSKHLPRQSAGPQARPRRLITFPNCWIKLSGQTSKSSWVTKPARISTLRWKEARLSVVLLRSQRFLRASHFLPGPRKTLSTSDANRQEA